ncbi:MAG: ABC transporter ATP-binding protein [Deltaproteobacteria bacterium]|nr:ABC transporter ATP-binding protein [Candidatus Anaeroferrophillus wilburensis]MBN2889831.1 ABC transporter ATP-binding protein [Deltaproteobacteria bacterium]
MLILEGITKSFAGFMAVNNAHLTVNEGEIVAVIGPNGAGKTTLFSLITGTQTPTTGSIQFKGVEIAGLAPHTICRRGISRSYQVVNIFHRLTVFENVQLAVLSRQGKTFNLWAPSRRLAVAQTMAILDSVGLADKAEQTSGMLSHGDQKVLEIAISLGTNPDLLIMDEPTAGMSVEETRMSIELIRRLSSEMGVTILFCEHDIDLVFSISHTIMVMQRGETIIQGNPAVVRENSRVKEAYLGEGNYCA